MADAHNNTTLEWRSIPSFPAYEVSEYGDVRRVAAASGTTVGLVLRRGYHKYGYPSYHLYKGGKRYGRSAHRLVAEAFLGPVPADKEVAHGDGDPTNSHWRNLRYATKKENEADKIRHGRLNAGERNGGAKLKRWQVDRVVELYRNGGYSQQMLGRQFGVSRTAIERIVNGKTWRVVRDGMVAE